MIHTLTTPYNARIAYDTQAGSSPGVMFFSGFKSDMSGTKAEALAAWCKARGIGYTRFDYRGHGQSSGAFEEGCIGEWAEDALTVLDKCTEGKQILVGSSMGGWIALLAALKRPERVAGLAGIAAAPDFTERLVWQQLSEAQKAEMQQNGIVYLPSCYDDQEPYAITRKLVEEGRRHLLLDAPIPIHCPVRLLHGTADADVPVELASVLMHRLESEDVRVTLVKGAGHRMSSPAELELLCAVVGELVGQV